MKLRLTLLAAVAVALVFSANVARAVGSEIAIDRGEGVGAGCTADATSALVRKFVRNYNSGRVAAIDRLWAPAPRFQWYSTLAPGRRLGRTAYDRRTLAAYFRARVRVRERIRLIEVSAGYDSNRNIVHFSGKLTRSADDMRRLKHLDFKGAADCESARPSLIVWSM